VLNLSCQPACRRAFDREPAPDINVGPMVWQFSGSNISWGRSRCFGSTIQQRPHGRKGLLLAPRLEGIDLRAFSFPLQFVKPIGQVAQALAEVEDRVRILLGL
jgi:hypothetical protein